jgi:hypothetical protein
MMNKEGAKAEMTEMRKILAAEGSEDRKKLRSEI